tara:strand:+ start:1312 stop:2118 length:807 start_codon:yes stop_codon:yes gene_type:complete
MKNKIYDCVTFFDNNFMFDLRYNILKDVVDYFIVCESRFDHKGSEKKINFIKDKSYDFNKVKHYILEKPFPKNNNAWQNQAIQRDFLLNCIENANPEDYILFSDPDEIPKPEILIDFTLREKYGIFMQKFYNYRFNIFNHYESPWEGTRVCKKKFLKSIDFMRQKIKSKNLNYSFLRIDKEKSIEIFNDGGWHFNNIFTAEEISLKLKTFAHSEFQSKDYSSVSIIRNKIKKKTDLFERGHIYKNVKIDESYPKYFINNIDKYKKWVD